jgi:hypothetical protein
MMVKAAREIPSTLTEIDLVTGEETHKPMAWKVMPPPGGKLPDLRGEARAERTAQCTVALLRRDVQRDGRPFADLGRRDGSLRGAGEAGVGARAAAGWALERAAGRRAARQASWGRTPTIGSSTASSPPPPSTGPRPRAGSSLLLLWTTASLSLTMAARWPPATRASHSTASAAASCWNAGTCRRRRDDQSLSEADHG